MFALTTFQPAFESDVRVVTSALMIEHPAASVATTTMATTIPARALCPGRFASVH
jgi:hypothetical protein